MPSKLSIQDVEVLSLTVKMSFLLISTLVSINMEDNEGTKVAKLKRD